MPAADHDARRAIENLIHSPGQQNIQSPTLDVCKLKELI